MKDRDKLIKAAQEIKLSDLAEKVILNKSFVSGIDDTVLLGRIRMLEVGASEIYKLIGDKNE